MPGSSSSKSIGLSELIYGVKRELLTPDSRVDDPVPLFGVEEIQVEVTVSVSRTGEGGINIQVLSLAAGASKEEAQTVRVILRPIYSREQLIAELSRALTQRWSHASPMRQHCF